MATRENIYITSIRIQDWLHVLGLTILGIGYYAPSTLLSLRAAISLSISSLYLAHGYSLNTCFDATVEQYWNTILSRLDKNFFRKLLLYSYSLFIINCIISFLYLPKIFYLVIFGSILSLIYSAPQLRLKKIPILSHLLNSAGFSILFIIGFLSISKTLTLYSIIMSIFFGLIFIPLQIIHQLSHYSTEERKELITFPKRRGQRTVVCSFNLSLFLILLWALMMCKVISNKYIYIFIPTFIFALLLFHYMRRLMTTKKIDAAYAYKIRLLFRKICIGYGIIIFFIYFLLPRP